MSKKISDGYPSRQHRYQAKCSRARKKGIDVAKWILRDARGSDRKQGFKFDLTEEWIKQQIAKGCTYCGETKLRMTLDRIDNDAGHLKSNCLPACIRCNYARRSMPYVAWLCLVRGMRKARRLGLFGTWTGRVR